jgi:hypothetical protein
MQHKYNEVWGIGLQDWPTVLPTFTVDPFLMDSQAILYSLQATVVAELVPKTKMIQNNIT